HGGCRLCTQHRFAHQGAAGEAARGGARARAHPDPPWLRLQLPAAGPRMRTMSLTLRLFLVGTLLLVATGWFALDRVLSEVKPAVRQSTEETLVDTANLLAELLAADMRAGTLTQGDLPRVLAAYG